MKRFCLSIAALGAACALAGCNETAGGAMASPVLGTPTAPAAFHLPPGAACTDEIDHFQTILHSDLATGNVEQKVYNQIQIELSRAASACSTGHGGESHALVAASKARHGYRA